GGAQVARRRVSPRHRWRRQPSPPALLAPPRRRRCRDILSPRRSRAFLRHVHRQLPRPGTRQDSPPMRPAQPTRFREERLMTGKRLDLVLINPPSSTQVYQGLGKELSAVENPVWAGLMATFCRRRGQSVVIIDAEAEGMAV